MVANRRDGAFVGDAPLLGHAVDIEPPAVQGDILPCVARVLECLRLEHFGNPPVIGHAQVQPVGAARVARIKGKLFLCLDSSLGFQGERGEVRWSQGAARVAARLDILNPELGDGAVVLQRSHEARETLLPDRIPGEI